MLIGIKWAEVLVPPRSSLEHTAVGAFDAQRIASGVSQPARKTCGPLTQQWSKMRVLGWGLVNCQMVHSSVVEDQAAPAGRALVHIPR